MKNILQKIKKESKKIAILAILFQAFFFASPALALPTGLVPIVPDACYAKPTVGADGRVTVTCGWNEFMQMGQNIINDAIYFAAMLAIISIVYAGYLYMTSGDDAGARKTANKVLWSVVQGIFFTLAAWLLVTTILKFLEVKDGFSLLE